jgi:hypothetical protein
MKKVAILFAALLQISAFVNADATSDAMAQINAAIAQAQAQATATANAQALVGKTQTVAIANDPNQFTVKYNLQSVAGPVDFSLALTGLDTTKMVADKDSSLDLYLGFGGNSNTNIDVVKCSILYKTTGSAFTCVDTYLDSASAPVASTVDTSDIVGVTTVTADWAKGNFEVKFTRPFVGTSTNNDYTLSIYSSQSYFWRLVQTISATTPGVSRQGTFQLDLSTGKIGAAPSGSFSVVSQVFSLFALLATSFVLLF